MRLSIPQFASLLLLPLLLIACRGQKTEKPPISPQQNMQFQDRFNAQEENSFFDNNMAMRYPVDGTVSRGDLRHDSTLFEGRDENGEFVTEIPMDVSRSFMYRGKERYDIYCSPCHGKVGNGQGIIMTGQYGYVPAPSFHRQASYDMPDGQFYSAITEGIRSMPAYNTQIKVEDRWAIVSYIRALQNSQNVPEEEIEQYDVDLAQLQTEFSEEQARQQALAEERAAAAGEEEISAARGEQLYTANACQTCHSLDGTRLVGPSFAGLFGKERNFADGTSTVADEEYLKQSIVMPSAKIVDGYDNAMANYDYLTDGEVQSLVEFIKAQSDN
ncbi:MAG: c-type cytochrome [Bacteroidetes bacterium]|jgi:mono/diheme cytochrome c family protein|nr:c-type cytochrome [Bacteroidota bacterium]